MRNYICLYVQLSMKCLRKKKMFRFTVEKVGFTFKIKAAHYCLMPTDDDSKVQVYNHKMVP